ncbi:MAG: hypothetical protein LBK01_06770 [Burkholderiaceae bacterium]|nr:hypothetical protein [Burkholderiaceae bacterium]
MIHRPPEKLVMQHAAVHRAIAEDPRTPPHILRKLVDNEKRRVRRVIAKINKRNQWPPFSSAKELISYTISTGIGVLTAVAANPGTPPDILSRLTEDEDRWPREALAQTLKMPPDILDRLAADESEFVRKVVAGNTGVPSGILAKLVDDESGGVRSAVAANPGTSPDILAKLAGDKSLWPPIAVAANPGTPPDILARPADDRSPNSSVDHDENREYREKTIS